MSTHPRDYAAVDAAATELRSKSYRAVPCYGVHPWFLHEVVLPPPDGSNVDGHDDSWLAELRQRLIDHPDAVVGEIGLDGARWREVDDDCDDDATADIQQPGNDNVSIWERKRILSCPMDLQRRAFEQQLLLAAELGRPASIHVVRAWGELFDSLDNVRESMTQRYMTMDEMQIDKAEASAGRPPKRNKKFKIRGRKLLPPKLYFHAFSGKAGILPSLLAACAKGNVPKEDVYFGFPPVIPTFDAPKTTSIMQAIGLDNLVLETDLEDMSRAWNDLIGGAEGIAAALDMDVDDVAERTCRNAERLYFGHET